MPARYGRQVVSVVGDDIEPAVADEFMDRACVVHAERFEKRAPVRLVGRLAFVLRDPFAGNVGEPHGPAARIDHVPEERSPAEHHVPYPGFGGRRR